MKTKVFKKRQRIGAKRKNKWSASEFGERGDRSDGGGAPDASEASLTLLSDVIVETEARGEAARRPWKMFRGGAKP